MDKETIILETLISEYIDTNEPISSKYLQEKLDIKISSATIRYYFKKLTQKGYLHKEHLSSGRIPSPVSLKEFWRKRLKQKHFLLDNMENFEKNTQEEMIFCEYTLFPKTKLVHLENYKDRFMIAQFENGEFIIPFNPKIYTIFDKLVGVNGLEISNICNDLGLVRLSMKLKEFFEEEFKVFNIHELMQLAQENEQWAQNDLQKVCTGEQLYKKKAGLDFHGNFLSYKFYLDINEEKRAEVLLMGHLHRNYLKLIQNLKKRS